MYRLCRTFWPVCLCLQWAQHLVTQADTEHVSATMREPLLSILTAPDATVTNTSHNQQLVSAGHELGDESFPMLQPSISIAVSAAAATEKFPVGTMRRLWRMPPTDARVVLFLWD
jgi:hypothetical protein